MCDFVGGAGERVISHVVDGQCVAPMGGHTTGNT